MMSVIALMVLLLPMALMTTSSEKLTGLALGVPGPTEEIPPEPPGPVEALRVVRVAEGYAVSAQVRRTDVVTSAGDTELKEFIEPDLASLQTRLASFKKMDDKRERITLAPAADTPTAEVVRWMDAVRRGPDGELYPRVILETVAAPPSGAAEPDGAEGAEGAEGADGTETPAPDDGSAP